MKYTLASAFGLVVLTGLLLAAEPEVAELTFDRRWQTPATSTNGLPRWIRGVEQSGGEFDDAQKCWIVGSAQPATQGRLSILIDREFMPEDLALGLLFSPAEQSDFVVQLFDAQDRVIILDLFGNLTAVSVDARTDTFIVPWRRFPSATKITIRRIKGDVKVFGAVLYPVVTPAETDPETAAELAKLLGDRLSPENPMFRAINDLASQRGKVPQWSRPVSTGSVVSNGAPGQVLDSPRLGDGWVVLPFYQDSCWPASKGEPGMVGKNHILLQGRPVRSLAVYSLPATIECDVLLEARAAGDGSLDLYVIPPGLPLDRSPKPMTNLRLIYSNTGDYGSVDRLDLNQTGTKADPLVWSKPAPLEAGKTYHVQMKLDATGAIQLSVNGQPQPVPKSLRIPYRQFQIQLGGWQPTNRWHVRNVVVR